MRYGAIGLVVRNPCQDTLPFILWDTIGNVFGPGRRCVSTTGGTATSARTCWSFKYRVDEGNWKRYKISDSVVVARRFRSTICTLVLDIVEQKF